MKTALEKKLWKEEPQGMMRKGKRRERIHKSDDSSCHMLSTDHSGSSTLMKSCSK